MTTIGIKLTTKFLIVVTIWDRIIENNSELKIIYNAIEVSVKNKAGKKENMIEIEMFSTFQ